MSGQWDNASTCKTHTVYGQETGILFILGGPRSSIDPAWLRWFTLRSPCVQTCCGWISWISTAKFCVHYERQCAQDSSLGKKLEVPAGISFFRSEFRGSDALAPPHPGVSVFVQARVMNLNFI